MQQIIYDLSYMPKGHTGHLCSTKDVVDAWQEFYRIFPFTNILEFGFNTGWSSALLLTMFPAVKVTSIEILKFNRASEGVKILKEKFPNRHDIVWGDSQIISKKVIKGSKKLPTEKYDLAFIDGGHSAPVVEKDIELSLHAGIKNFVFDDAQLSDINLPMLAKSKNLKLVTEKIYTSTKWKYSGYRFSSNLITLGYYQTV
jgi:hypothetical protein